MKAFLNIKPKFKSEISYSQNEVLADKYGYCKEKASLDIHNYLTISRSQSEAGFNKRSVPSHFVDPADHADNVQKSLDNLAETFSSIFQFFLHNSPNISSEPDPYEKVWKAVYWMEK